MWNLIDHQSSMHLICGSLLTFVDVVGSTEDITFLEPKCLQFEFEWLSTYFLTKHVPFAAAAVAE